MYHRRYIILLVAILSLFLGARTDSLAARRAVPAQPGTESRALSTFIPANTVRTAPAEPSHAGSIRGRVVLRGPAQRQAAYVLALRGADIVGQAPIDPRGNYALLGLAPGTYTLRVADAQQRSLALSNDTPVRLAPGEARRLNLDVDGSTPGASPPALAPAGIALAPADCASGGTASISGTVRAPNGTPIQYVYVYLYTFSGSQLTYTYTSITGVYTFTNLAAGSYLIQFDTQSTSTPYKGEWYNNQASQASATPIAVAAGATLTGIDATLEVGAQITGKVTADGMGGPLANAYVTVYDSDENPVAAAYTDASGVYTATPGLSSGSYRVFFQAPDAVYLSEYYNNRPDFASADAVVVTAPNRRTGIDAVLARGALVAGRVTAADTHLGLPNVYVNITNSAGDDLGSAGRTDSAGYYTTTLGLASGSYRLRFTPSYPSDYLSAERTITVSAPNLFGGADIALALGGQISGHVADSTTAPFKNVYVDVSDEAIDFEQAILTDAAGNYTIHGLPSGSYTVSFSPPSPYLKEYYNNQPASPLAQLVGVTAPQIRSGIDAVLDRGGAIAGRVTAADTGLGLKDVYVQVLDLSDYSVASLYTDASGYYTTTALLSGAYRVQFEPSRPGTACAYIPEYSNHQSTLAASDPVLIDGPNTTSNINAVLERGSAISGRVTAAGSGAGLGDAYVEIYNSAGETVAWGSTDPSGHYVTAPPLPSGSYRVGFFSYGAYIEEYYTNKPTLLASNPISVTAPQDKTGVDAALERGGAISGMVTDATTGIPVQYSGILVYNQAGAVVARSYTDAFGKYTASPLPSGSYRLLFSSGSAVADVALQQAELGGAAVAAAPQQAELGGYLDQYYNHASTLAAATPVAVNAPATTTNINAAVTRGSTISGRVTAAGSGAPLPSVWVDVYDSQGTLVTAGYTKADGTYTTFDALPSGAYRVQFSPRDASASYASEYYNDRASLASATSITVHAPTNATGINAALAKGGRISGIVTAAENGAGLPNINIEVYDSGGNIVATGETETSGAYITTAMPNGAYRVRFVPSDRSLLGQYSAEFYNDKLTLATATVVPVTTPNTTAGINAVLSRGTQISGQIHVPATSDPSEVQVVVYDSSGAQVATGETNLLGFYQVAPALRSGSYRVGFKPRAGGGYVASFYHGKLTLASADPVNVTAPNPRGGIDDTLLSPRAVYLPLIRR